MIEATAVPIETVISAFEAARDQWQMCDWPTEFGVARLNLCGLRAEHAVRLAKAMSGAESRRWLEAARWLRTVEDSAREAQQAARNAVDAAQRGMLDEAQTSIDLACTLESAWHVTPVWLDLRMAIDSLANSYSRDLVTT